MTFLSVIELVAEYNRNKPAAYGPDANQLYEVTPQDMELIGKIIHAHQSISLPFKTQIVMLDKCKQIHIRCTQIPKTKTEKKTKSVSLPNIYENAKKV